MSGIGATIGKIFGTDKAITSVIDNVSKGIDALIYTDEEKAVDAAKDRSAARGMVIKWMESTQGQNLARRLIALCIVIVWLLQYLCGMILSVIGIWVSDPEKILASAKVIGEFAERMNGAVMLILGFYFAAPYMGNIVQGAITKFGGQKITKGVATKR
ncbi:hypothetical protein KA005_85600 [bacterium]|nr:hypothetical protein [bacterium]